MVDMFNIGSSGFKQNSYGNIQKIGMTPNGRTVYRVIDSNGEETGKLSVPQTESDKFESAYKDIMDTAPKIQKFVIENSSEEDIKKRRTLSRVIVGTGGITFGKYCLHRWYYRRSNTNSLYKKFIHRKESFINCCRHYRRYISRFCGIACSHNPSWYLQICESKQNILKT